jgi:hypothetical protein
VTYYGNSVDVLRYCIVHPRYEDMNAAVREIKLYDKRFD